MNCRTEIICLLLAVVWAAVNLSAASLAELPVGSVIACEGSYGDHIQGMATDGEAIYWSFASTLVKTDLNGKVLKSVPVPYHCGDPCWADGALYVPYGGGSWNREIGDAESRNFIRVYNAELELTGEHHVPEVVYGAGCIEFRSGKFYVGGGLPDGKGENYIYEYDAKFRFVKRHAIPVSSHLGVQTIKYAAGSFWLGCYGKPNFCIRTDEQFRIRERYDYATTVGVIPLGGTADRVKLLVAWHIFDPQAKGNRARAVVLEVTDGVFRRK